MLRTFMFISPVHICQVGLCIILWTGGLGCEGAVSEKFGCKSVGDNGDGLNI